MTLIKKQLKTIIHYFATRIVHWSATDPFVSESEPESQTTDGNDKKLHTVHSWNNAPINDPLFSTVQPSANHLFEPDEELMNDFLFNSSSWDIDEN